MKVRLQPIKPKVQAINVDRARQLIKRATDDSAYEVLQDFEATVETWDTPVTFTVKSDGPNREIGTKSKIYEYVDLGTKPHIIEPKKKTVLKFGLNSLPKTTPGNIASGPGRPGSPFIFRKRVRHPGTKARKFSETIRRRRQALLARKIQDALREL